MTAKDDGLTLTAIGLAFVACGLVWMSGIEISLAHRSRVFAGLITAIGAFVAIVGWIAYQHDNRQGEE